MFYGTILYIDNVRKSLWNSALASYLPIPIAITTTPNLSQRRLLVLLLLLLLLLVLLLLLLLLLLQEEGVARSQTCRLGSCSQTLRQAWTGSTEPVHEQLACLLDFGPEALTTSGELLFDSHQLTWKHGLKRRGRQQRRGGEKRTRKKSILRYFVPAWENSL